MMPLSAEVPVRKDVLVAILIGVVEVAVGLIVVAASAYERSPKSDIPDWLLAAASELGTGLIAAGVLTLVVETRGILRHRADLAAVKQAHFESILKGLMPEPIFAEIRTHIIDQPFIREDFRVIFDLSWADESKTELKRSDLTIYNVRNVSRTTSSYEIFAFNEIREDGPEFVPQIVRVEIEDLISGSKRSYNGQELKDQGVLRTDDPPRHRSARVRTETMRPEQLLRVEVETTGRFLSRDHFNFYVLFPTVGFDFTVMHPNDLVVTANLLSPSGWAFREEAPENARSVKHWRIEGGLLPYQGLELSWKPLQVPVPATQLEILPVEQGAEAP